jgi:hypothetical protein
MNALKPFRKAEAIWRLPSWDCSIASPASLNVSILYILVIMANDWPLREGRFLNHIALQHNVPHQHLQAVVGRDAALRNLVCRPGAEQRPAALL